MNRYRYVLGRLFAEPSLAEGAARVLDLGGTLQQYNESQTAQEADADALKNDWRAVGDDIRFSIAAYEQSKQYAQSA
jgi:hypothetical protein